MRLEILISWEGRGGCACYSRTCCIPSHASSVILAQAADLASHHESCYHHCEDGDDLNAARRLQKVTPDKKA